MLRHSLHIILPFILIFASISVVQAQSVVSAPEVRAKDPVLSPEGNTLFFTRLDHESNKGSDDAADIWIRERDANGEWQRALNPGSPINTFAHDRALGISPDGQRLAVLRTGVSDHLEILEATGRNWRIINSWPLPADVAPRYDLTFNPNSLELVYSTYGPNGSLDLMKRTALRNGKWTKAVSLDRLNGPDNEMNPSYAADGRTLYFRRDNDIWWRQDNPGEAPFQTIISRRIRQFATTPAMGTTVIATSSSPGVGEVLIETELEAGDLPLYSTVHRGFLVHGLPEGQLTATVEINGVHRLAVRPDVLKRYAIFLRPGELLNPDAEYTNLPVTGEPEGGLASTNATIRETSADRKALETGIANREAELRRMEEERRLYQEYLKNNTDALMAPDYLSARDTLPPRQTAKGTTTNSTRARYVEELNELERMKAKFRKQQEEKLRGTTRQNNYNWSQPEVTNPKNATQPNTYARPDLATAYGNRQPQEELTPYQREQLRQDSLRMEANIQSGLYPDQSPKVYEREPWENQLSQSLPRREPISASEAARLDREYERKLAELEALKTQLRNLENRSTTPAPQSDYYAPREDYRQQEWTAKQAPAPATYDHRTTQPYPEDYRTNRSVPSPANTTTAKSPYYANPEPAPATYNRAAVAAPSTAAGIPAGISFIPNTAYPNAAGYDGLDQLVNYLRSGSQRGPLEVRVHVAVELDRRVAQLLSEERAVTIRDYLTEQGVAATAFRVVGYGNHLTGNGGERVELIRQ
ncbi:OmpA family protein [Lewinella sp. W8]|uniref:OmpA family protein n=1 Tax=Lewinella sp. W8 TaxID=2528208 RepID=UPI0010685076|nr:OmpA family protein [Lewinella sp. W8]MTB52443.1 OmpA family protein [Lewinella sp. W8]